MITVVIVDAQPVFRRGLARMVELRPELTLLHDGAVMPAVQELARQRPDVLVADPAMLWRGGEPFLRHLIGRKLPTRVLLLTSVLREGAAYRALAAGASGYLSKGCEERELMESIHRVARGEIVIAPELQGDVVAGIRMREAVGIPALSCRECEVLALLTEGLSAPQIGERLHISRSTVRTHLVKIYARLDVADRAAAVARGIRLGLIE